MSLSRHVVRIELGGEWQGQGVVIADELVLTAAHCLPPPDASCFLTDETYVRIRLPDGREGHLQAVFIDAVSDVAALGPSDDDPFLLDDIKPIPVDLSWSGSTGYVERPPMPGRIFTHDAGEIPITWREANSGMALFTPSRHIFGGTSGGPIVGSDGRLIGVVSRTSGTRVSDPKHPVEPGDDEEGFFRMLGASLPAWVAARIAAAQCGGDASSGA